uniref:CENP-V/GFA domain-containing protein n=1 Tax=Ascaris lumbricoides TaxID=6252 RepID=A0A0M3HWF3_ASCLU
MSNACWCSSCENCLGATWSKDSLTLRFGNSDHNAALFVHLAAGLWHFEFACIWKTRPTSIRFPLDEERQSRIEQGEQSWHLSPFSQRNAFVV